MVGLNTMVNVAEPTVQDLAVIEAHLRQTAKESSWYIDHVVSLEEAKGKSFSELEAFILDKNTLATTRELLEHLEQSKSLLLPAQSRCSNPQCANPQCANPQSERVFLSAYLIAAKSQHIFESPTDIDDLLLANANEMLKSFEQNMENDHDFMTEARAHLEAFHRAQMTYYETFSKWESNNRCKLTKTCIDQYLQIESKCFALFTNPNPRMIEVYEAFAKQREILRGKIAELMGAEGLQMLDHDLQKTRAALEASKWATASEEVLLHELALNPEFVLPPQSYILDPHKDIVEFEQKKFQERLADKQFNLASILGFVDSIIKTPTKYRLDTSILCSQYIATYVAHAICIEMLQSPGSFDLQAVPETFYLDRARILDWHKKYQQIFYAEAGKLVNTLSVPLAANIKDSINKRLGDQLWIYFSTGFLPETSGLQEELSQLGQEIIPLLRLHVKVHGEFYKHSVEERLWKPLFVALRQEQQESNELSSLLSPKQELIRAASVAIHKMVFLLSGLSLIQQKIANADMWNSHAVMKHSVMKVFANSFGLIDMMKDPRVSKDMMAVKLIELMKHVANAQEVPFGDADEQEMTRMLCLVAKKSKSPGYNAFLDELLGVYRQFITKGEMPKLNPTKLIVEFTEEIKQMGEQIKEIIAGIKQAHVADDIDPVLQTIPEMSAGKFGQGPSYW